MNVTDDANERTRFEMYYQPFQGAIEAGVASIMCSYNRVLGRWSCENPTTLAGDLKERLDFKVCNSNKICFSFNMRGEICIAQTEPGG